MQATYITRLTFVFTVSVVLFLLVNKYSPPIPVPKFNSKLDSQHSSLVKAYVIGDKSNLPSKIKIIHKQLNIYHLFTPSGIHFTAILLLLGLFKSRKLQLLAIPLPFLLPGLFSIKRIALIRGLSILQKRYLLRIHPFYIFLAVFALDFAIGNFRNSPLSFIYSFLFLGIIFCTFKKAKIKMVFYLLIGQMLMASLQNETINLAASLLGIIITSGFIVIFPIILLYFFIPLPTSPLDFIIGHYLNILEFAYNKTINFPKIDFSIILVLVAIISTLNISHYKKGIFIGFLLLFKPIVIH